MAHYLVHAAPKREKMQDLGRLLAQRAFEKLEPFGETLTESLRGARLEPDGHAVWEEEDYCSPPLAQEREAVLDEHFDNLKVERVKPGEGWARIESLPRLFPDLNPEDEPQ